MASPLLSSLGKAARRARNLPALLRRAPLFANPFSFVRSEISEVNAAVPHRLRGSDLSIYIRHHSTDVGVLNEVFLKDVYRFPDLVSSRLSELSRPPRVLDLGGHVGMFGVYIFQRWPTALVTSVEPDPLNAVILRRCVRRNRKFQAWTVIEAAVTNQTGTAWLKFGQGAASQLCDGEADDAVEVQTIDAFDLLREADVVKMDIEGAEWQILNDPRLATIRPAGLVLEYHRAGCPDRDPRSAIEAALVDADFAVRHVPSDTTEMGVCWAWPAQQPAPGVVSASRPRPASTDV